MKGRDLTFRELFLIMENTINASLIRYIHIIGVSFLSVYIFILDGVFIMEVSLKRLFGLEVLLFYYF